MKKIGGVFALLIAGLFAASAVSAQNLDRPGFGPGMMGHGFGPGGIEWKAGTSILTEYKKSSGQVAFGESFTPLFKADGVGYALELPPREATQLSNVKNGDTVTFEGLAVTIKVADKDPQYIFHPFKAVVNGKTIDLAGWEGHPGFERNFGDNRGPGMMGGAGWNSPNN